MYVLLYICRLKTYKHLIMRKNDPGILLNKRFFLFFFVSTIESSHTPSTSHLNTILKSSHLYNILLLYKILFILF